MAKGQLTTLYQKHFPESPHKLPPKQLEEVNDSLTKSYVDDLEMGVTPKAVEIELLEPTFIYNDDFSSCRLGLQGSG